MYSSNLSKLATNSYFATLLKEENLVFDAVFFEGKSLEGLIPNGIHLNQPLKTLLKHHQLWPEARILIILEQLNSHLIMESLQSSTNCIIINTFDGISSFGKKTKPDIDAFFPMIQSGFCIHFPKDEQDFLRMLWLDNWKHLLSLTNQEVAENIYQVREEDTLTIIDQSLAANPEIITLINNSLAPTHLIAMGQYFEEWVKLSQLLLQHSEPYHFSILSHTGNFAHPDLKTVSKKAKKLIILIDQLPDPTLCKRISEQLNIDPQIIHFLTPEYSHLSSISPEYQLEQAKFDAQAIISRLIHY